MDYIKWGHKVFSDSEISQSIETIFANNHLLSLATVAESDGKYMPLNATCGYAYDESLNIIVLTPPSSEHGKALEKNPHVALTIFDSRQDQTEAKVGLQIKGACVPGHQTDMLHVLEKYQERYEWMRNFVRWHEDWQEESERSWLYKISPKSIKIFDEKRFGNEQFVSVTIPGPHMKV